MIERRKRKRDFIADSGSIRGSDHDRMDSFLNVRSNKIGVRVRIE